MTLSDFGSKAKQLLATIAPLIGTAVGGPLGAAAGALLSNALGTPAGDTKAAETALLSANPEMLLKIKSAEEAFQVQMKTLGVTEEQLQYADVANARAMQVQLKSTTPTILSYIVLGVMAVSFLGVLTGLMPVPNNPQAAVIYGSVLTYLLTESKAVLGYWFGSSIGSDKKTDALTDIAKAP
jgi:hypothetical protein